MREDLRIFFQDVVDHTECPECGALQGVVCDSAVPAGAPPEFGTHEARAKLRRSQMTDDDFAEFGLKILASYMGGPN